MSSLRPSQTQRAMQHSNNSHILVMLKQPIDALTIACAWWLPPQLNALTTHQKSLPPSLPSQLFVSCKDDVVNETDDEDEMDD